MRYRIFRTVLVPCFIITACLGGTNKSNAFDMIKNSDATDEWYTPISGNCAISAAYQYTPYQDSYWSEKQKKMIPITPPKIATGFAAIIIKQRTGSRWIEIEKQWGFIRTEYVIYPTNRRCRNRTLL